MNLVKLDDFIELSELDEFYKYGEMNYLDNFDWFGDLD